MGNAKFYYFPIPDGGRLVEIDLGEKLGELFSEFEYDVTGSISRAGRRYMTHGYQREVVTIQRDRMLLGEELALKLQSMQNHLDRGGYVSFCADSDFSYIFPLLKPAIRSVSLNTLKLGANPFQNYTGLGLPQVGHFVTIHTESPHNIYEYKKIQSFAPKFSTSEGGELTVTPDLDFTTRKRSFLRYYRFWPTMKRPLNNIGKSIITSEGGRLFSLNLKLYLDNYLLFSFHNAADGVNRTPNFAPSTTNNVPAASGGRANTHNPFLIEDTLSNRGPTSNTRSTEGIGGVDIGFPIANRLNR